MPVGVKITTSLRTGPTNPTGPESSAWFVGGITDRGPTSGDIPPVHNIAEYEATWGARTEVSGLLYDQALTYFAEGGGVLYVARAVGTGATAASVTLKNAATPTAQDAVKVSANSAGPWGAELTVAVAAGTAGTVTVSIRRGTTVLESYPNKTTCAEVVSVLAASQYVDATLLGALDAAADLAVGTFPLTGGNSDTATVNLATITAALARFGEDYGPGAISIPGYTGDTVASGLLANCQANYRVAIVAGPQGASMPELGATASGAVALAEYGAVFAPWVIIPDGSATRTISPEGYVAGVRARAFSIEDAFWQVPAGQRATARFIRGTDISYTLADINTLADTYNVNGIITRRGAVYLYQYQSLSTDANQWELLQSRDTINGLIGRLGQAVEPFVWEVIDGKRQLEMQVIAAMIGVLQPVSDQGGLYAEYDADGNVIHPGYIVSATSTPDQLGHNIIAAQAAVKLSPFAGLIMIELVKASFTAPLV